MFWLRCALLGIACLLASCSANEANRSNDTQKPEPRINEQNALTPPADSRPTLSPEIGPSGVNSSPERADITADLNDLVIPLDTTEPIESTDDLGPAMDSIGDAEVVGLGESTHGTHEFITIRHRIVRLLVKEMGFTHIAVEAPWAGIEVANDYVQGDMDDPSAAQDGLSYFMLQNAEFWEMMQWLRDHNLRTAPDENVRLVGIDPQSRAAESAAAVLEFLQAVDPGAYERIAGLYDGISDPSSTSRYLARTREAFEYLEDRRETYVALATEEAYEHALHAARVIYQGRQLLVADIADGFQLRDQFMADNVDRVRRNAGTGSRIVIWAHNSHVSMADPYTLEGVRSLGGLLSDRFGDRYFALGFDFSEGAFNARSIDNPTGPLSAFTVSSSREDMFAHLFQTLEPAAFFLDLRMLDPSSPAGEWLSTRHAMWSVGCCYSPLSEPLIFIELATAFDGLVFVKYTNETTLLE